MKRVLVFGGGLIGGCVARAFAKRDHSVRLVPHVACDVTKPDDVRRILFGERTIDVVVNATGYVRADAAETDEVNCYRLNALAPAILAEQAADRVSPAIYVHFSSDAVFDGTTPFADEMHAPAPISVYGRSKLAGDDAVARLGVGRYFLVRVGNVYGQRGKNNASRFTQKQAEPIIVNRSRFAAPTPAALIATKTADLVDLAHGGGVYGVRPASGVYHLMCTGQTDWHAFTAEAQELLGGAPPRVADGVYGDAPRGRHGTLRSVLLPLYGITMPDWLTALREDLDARKDASSCPA